MRSCRRSLCRNLPAPAVLSTHLRNALMQTAKIPTTVPDTVSCPAIAAFVNEIFTPVCAEVVLNIAQCYVDAIINALNLDLKCTLVPLTPTVGPVSEYMLLAASWLVAAAGAAAAVGSAIDCAAPCHRKATVTEHPLLRAVRAKRQHVCAISSAGCCATHTPQACDC